MVICIVSRGLPKLALRSGVTISRDRAGWIHLQHITFVEMQVNAY